MNFHETEHGMTHEDIVPLVDRVASLLATERGLSPERAATLAHKMLHELTGDVGNDYNVFVWEGAPTEAAQRRIAYWTEEQHWQAIDPDIAQTLRAAKATHQEIEVLVMG
ncbi:MAG TPA: hypothetical protein VN203_04455 [Candidatus Acidoferrum sp.]|nr:hypothetical protein [Candidatus Acidoferrum sp.]